MSGDHVLPVVWNHHLYLFWALFEQKADKTVPEDLNKDGPGIEEPLVHQVRVE